MNQNNTARYSERMDRVCDYIHQNLSEKLTLTRLSEVANFSKYHFHRQFSGYIGMSVARFIQLMRLKRASYPLAFDKHIQIIDIAQEAQFENPESFSRAFKNVVGQTPSDFRKSPDWPNWHSKFKFNLPIRAENTMNIDIVDFPETKIAKLEHLGPPELILETVSKFRDWRKQSGLSPVKTSKTFGIPYSDPDVTEPNEFRFDVCGSLETDVPNNPQGVFMSAIPGGRCAVTRHAGNLDNIGDTVRARISNGRISTP